MERLIKADSLKEKFGACMFRGDTIRSIINEQPTVEAIPKDQYIHQLKADMVAILNDIKARAWEHHSRFDDDKDFEVDRAIEDIVRFIDVEINKLQVESEE